TSVGAAGRWCVSASSRNGDQAETERPRVTDAVPHQFARPGEVFDLKGAVVGHPHNGDRRATSPLPEDLALRTAHVYLQWASAVALELPGYPGDLLFVLDQSVPFALPGDGRVRSYPEP